MQLRAGDGVAYVSPTILHWGSSYTPTMRREPHDLLIWVAFFQRVPAMIVRTGTIHGGFTVGMTTVCRPALLRHLGGSAREKYERWEVSAFVLVLPFFLFRGACPAFSTAQSTFSAAAVSR